MHLLSTTAVVHEFEDPFDDGLDGSHREVGFQRSGKIEEVFDHLFRTVDILKDRFQILHQIRFCSLRFHFFYRAQRELGRRTDHRQRVSEFMSDTSSERTDMVRLFQFQNFSFHVSGFRNIAVVLHHGVDCTFTREQRKSMDLENPRTEILKREGPKKHLWLSGLQNEIRDTLLLGKRGL